MVNKSLINELQLLNLFTIDKPELSLAEITRLSGTPKATVLRTLNSFEDFSFVTKTESGKYKLGVGLLRLGNLVLDNMDIHTAALPHMRNLSRETDLTVRLLIRDNLDAILIDKINPMSEIYVYNMSGLRIRLYNGASARAIYSFLPENEIDELLVKFKEIDELSDERISEIKAVTKKEKKQGYSLSVSERMVGTAGMGMPIFDYKGNVAGCISVAGLTTDFTDVKIERMSYLLKEAATNISSSLGYLFK